MPRRKPDIKPRTHQEKKYPKTPNLIIAENKVNICTSQPALRFFREETRKQNDTSSRYWIIRFFVQYAQPGSGNKPCRQKNTTVPITTDEDATVRSSPAPNGLLEDAAVRGECTASAFTTTHDVRAFIEQYSRGNQRCCIRQTIL